MIYFPGADISLVWLPSAQRQPPAHEPFCIYVVIITKGDLNQIACLIYKGRSLPSGSKSYKRLKQIINIECWYKISNHVKTESKRNPKTNKKRVDFCGSRDKKKKEIWFDPILCPTGLFWSWLSHSVRPSPAGRRPLPATQTVRENMTSPLYHPLDTLEAHSSAGSNARCRWRLMLIHWSKRSCVL